MATVVGLFDNVTQAQNAVQQLRSAGVGVNDIGIAMRSTDTTPTGTTVADVATSDTGVGGAATGAMTGGALGGLAGLLIGIGAITIPGIGPVVAAGPLGTALATTLVGAGIGAATGGIIGALVDAGVPEEDARLYQTGVERGGVLVTARVPATEEQATLDILNANGARNVNDDATNYNDPNWKYGTNGKIENTGTAHGTPGAGSEAAGGLAGAAAGAAIGTAVAGPLGTGVGAVIGGLGGAGLASAGKGDDAGETTGAGAGAAAGAATGGALGAVGGPLGMAAGAAIGAAVGGAAGKGTSDAAAEATDDVVNDDDTVVRDENYRGTNYNG